MKKTLYILSCILLILCGKSYSQIDTCIAGNKTMFGFDYDELNQLALTPQTTSSAAGDMTDFYYTRVYDTDVVYGNINVSNTPEGQQLFVYPLRDTILARSAAGWALIQLDQIGSTTRNWYSNGGSSSTKIFQYNAFFQKIEP